MTENEFGEKTITELLYLNNPEQASILLALQRKLGWKEEQKFVSLEVMQKEIAVHQKAFGLLWAESCRQAEKINAANRILDELDKEMRPKNYNVAYLRLREVLK